ncbi:MAG: hypothetical protein KC621_25020 [Myxococcales bacterium]|nr:hypothetical protein [Myxococcales bacterium]
MWWWLACTSGETRVAPTDTEDVDDTAAIGATGDTGPTDVGALAVTVLDGPIHTQRSLRVELPVDAGVAGRCVSVDDPAEVLFAESAAPAHEHELRFGGLLPDTTYECRVVLPEHPEIATTTVPLVVGERPAVLPEALVSTDPALGMTGAFTLGSWYDEGCQGDTRQAWLILWDPEGRIRWWKQLPEKVGVDVEALYHPDIDAIVWGGGGSVSGVITIEPLWDTSPSYAGEQHPDPDHSLFHHDATRLPDGTLLTLEADPISLGGDTWIGFRVRRHDPISGELLLDLRSQTVLDDGQLTPWHGGNPDAYHANAISWRSTADGPRLFLSLCAERAILVIDGTDGELLMRVDDTWEVHDADGSVLPAHQFPQCQHGIELLDDHTLLVYDNGRNRKETRAERLRLDEVQQTITREWWWSDGRFEGNGGDIDPLTEDRVLTTFSHMECLGSPPGLNEVVEVDVPTGRIASRLTLPESDDILYRSQRYDGCELFGGTRYCGAAMARADALAALFDREAVP